MITDNQCNDHYYFEGRPVLKGDMATLPNISKRVYASLLDAIKDSEPYKNEHYSDGECLDYVLNAIQQLEKEFL